eukprot:1264274-Ditylum_brightwellii.AAC.1
MQQGNQQVLRKGTSKTVGQHGRTVPIDNYYRGADALIKLKENGVFAHCTHRQNRKHCCPFVRMTAKDSW